MARSGATDGRVVEVEAIDLLHQMDPLRQLQHPVRLFRSDEISNFEAKNGNYESKDEQGLERKMNKYKHELEMFHIGGRGCCRADDRQTRRPVP